MGVYRSQKSGWSIYPTEYLVLCILCHIGDIIAILLAIFAGNSASALRQSSFDEWAGYQ